MDRVCEYAIVRLVPQAYRGELVNVGLIVFDGPKLDIRVYPQVSLLKSLGLASSALDWIASALLALDDPDLPARSRWDLLSRVPGLALSDMGWFVAETDEQYNLRIDGIRTDYIDRPHAPLTKKRTTSLVRELSGLFRDYHIMGKVAADVHRHKVVANVPVGPAGKLHVDFVVKNGVYHATETADFRNVHEIGDTELKEAALASFTLRYAREQLGSADTKCYLVYSATPIVEATISPALELAEGSVDRLFNLESPEDKRDYIDIILSAAGSPRFNSATRG